MKPLIILVTNNFPYYPGEYFLEAEIEFWEKTNVEFIILPNHKGNEQLRSINPIIKVDNYLLENKKKSFISKIFNLFRIIASKIFWREIIYNYEDKITYNFIISHIRRVSEVLTKKWLFETFTSKFETDRNIIFYFYWNDLQSYAASIMNRSDNINVITRAHGYDVYKERKRNNYMPLKWQFVDFFDAFYAISKEGKQYLQDTYKVNSAKVFVSRLGVLSNDFLTPSTDKNSLHILSCASCIELKRLDKIIEALTHFGTKTSNINILWTHIGSGELYSYLYKYASDKLNGLENVSFQFLGTLPNNQVHDFYKNNSIDVFCNTSDFEGLPVSIMEALSYGVPVIAPNVGGISEAIDKSNGTLLSKGFSIKDLVSAFENYSHFKKENIRKNAFYTWKENFSAETNYKTFIQHLIAT